jgi:cysteine-rich repeat protein
LGGKTCQSQGFGSGTLSCTPACTLNTNNCSLCGNGVIDAGENCDDNNTMSGDGCSPTCQIEILMCDPDGTYMIQGAPVSYSCCFGLVSVNISSFIFSNNGATIASSPSNPKTMTGSATTCPSGNFNDQSTIPGGCAETYKLTGSFTGANTWTGTYELQFTGSDCSCFGGADTPCVSQIYPITATR